MCAIIWVSPAFFWPLAGFYAFFAVMPYTVTVHMTNFCWKKMLHSKICQWVRGGEADPLNGPGLGVEVNGKNLTRLSESFITITASKP
jgi:hypothetical protein